MRDFGPKRSQAIGSHCAHFAITAVQGRKRQSPADPSILRIQPSHTSIHVLRCNHGIADSVEVWFSNASKVAGILLANRAGFRYIKSINLVGRICVLEGPLVAAVQGCPGNLVR